MEYASAKALNMNVHFIPKSSTDSALSFLRSPFGQRLKNKDKFRIVTDMNREYEQPSHNAGARLIKALRRTGFRNECMIFTSDKREADQIIKSELNSRDQQFVTVTTEASDLQTFVDFDQEPRYTHHPEMGNSEKFEDPMHHSKLTALMKLRYHSELRTLMELSEFPRKNGKLA
ncbi:unnamed protein product [Didymodactylos carnosus]|uniref:Uncharacterized protein n=1 Tax=Didymodactylos carnosus TaxID=1234261 RepID=A0A8S2G8D7_9BILA|nr:unnamed protein product [Didymodactylos carnosus]CAF4462846.1 unnamed protein product [Didymodactylos carnosus]